VWPFNTVDYGSQYGTALDLFIYAMEYRTQLNFSTTRTEIMRKIPRHLLLAAGSMRITGQ
jgi:hypothetical protein